MNKKIISLSLSLSVLFSSTLSPVWAGGLVGEGNVRADIPSVRLSNFSLGVSPQEGAMVDPLAQGNQESLQFEEGVGAIQNQIPSIEVQPSAGPQQALSSVANTNNEKSPVQMGSSQGFISTPHALFPASQSPKAASSRISLVRQLASVVRTNLTSLRSKLFDGEKKAPSLRALGVSAFAPSIRPLPKLKLPKGVKTDAGPIIPDARHLPQSSLWSRNALAVSNGQNSEGFAPNGQIFDALTEIPLQADPQNGVDIERAVREFVDQNPQYQVKSRDLGTSKVRLVEVPGQLPTWYVDFHQQYQSVNVDGTPAPLPVYGANMNFTIHVKNGKAVIVGVYGRLFPEIKVDASPKFSDQMLESRIRGRLKIQNDLSRKISFKERQIFYIPSTQTHAGAWHAISLYKVEGIDALVAADIATGQTFLWDMRLGAASPTTGPPASATASAQFEARVPLSDHDMTDPPHLTQVPLPGVTVKLADGKEIVADDQGRVNVDLADDQPVEVTARLDGPRVMIKNASGNPLEVQAQLVKGKDGVIAVFNPSTSVNQPQPPAPQPGFWGKVMRVIKRLISPSYRAQEDAAAEAKQQAEQELAQVTAYYSHYTFINWVQAHGIGKKDNLLDQKLTINVNIADECNAYYDPSSNTLNFFLSSARCINTGTLPGVSFHESGHWTHALVAGYVSMGLKAMASVDPGLGEGIGDMFATHILETPLIGEHFFNDPSQSPLPNGALRETTNHYQFSPNSEVHEQGLAFMGTVGYGGAWHSLLIQALGGDKALGLLQGLIFPHIYGYATATDIPAALGVIYLAAKALTDASVQSVAMKTLQEAASKHGINLPVSQKQNPQTPAGPSA